MSSRCELADYAKIPRISKTGKVTWVRKRIWACDWQDKLRKVFRGLDYEYTEELVSKLTLVYYPHTNPSELGRRMSLEHAYLMAELSVLKSSQNRP